MNAADFVLSTLSHFVKGSEGPPPGVPARVDAGFETRFAAMSVDHGVTPIVSRSLDTLALPPSFSRVTATRLKTHAEATLAEASRRIRLASRVVEALGEAGVGVLVMGDVLGAAALYDRGGPRAVKRIELLVREGDTRAALAAAESVGFTRPGVHPVFGDRAEVRPVDGTGGGDVPRALARELLEFHHYMAPLVLWNDGGDQLEFRYRVMRLGHPDVSGDRAWERARDVQLAGVDARGLAWEDHLVDLVVRIGIAGYTDLAAITDAGLLLRRHADSVEWGHVAFRTRMHGAYSAFHHALRHVCRALALPAPTDAERLEAPPVLYEKWFDLFWQPASIDYLRASGDRRFLYGLAACGGPLSKINWAWRCWMPRPAWVANLVGPASSPMNWLEFMMAMRELSRTRADGDRRSRTAGTDNVTRFERKKR